MTKHTLLLTFLLLIICLPAFAQYTGGGGGGAASASSDQISVPIPTETKNMSAPIETIPAPMPAQPTVDSTAKACFICPALFIILTLLAVAAAMPLISRRKSKK